MKKTLSQNGKVFFYMCIQTKVSPFIYRGNFKLPDDSFILCREIHPKTYDYTLSMRGMLFTKPFLSLQQINVVGINKTSLVINLTGVSLQQSRKTILNL